MANDPVPPADLPPTKPKNRPPLHKGPGRPRAGNMTRLECICILERTLRSSKTPVQYKAGIARALSDLRGWTGPADGSDRNLDTLAAMLRRWEREDVPPAALDDGSSGGDRSMREGGQPEAT